MELNINLAREIAVEHKIPEEILILDRLEGIWNIFKGDYTNGEAVLNEVLNKINGWTGRERLILIEAGTLNYLGESIKRQKRYTEAIGYYEKAIDICKSHGLAISGTIFYANATQAAYLKNDKQSALYFFEHAIKVFSQFDYPWGKATAFGYAALIKLEEGRYEECLNYITQAAESTNSTKNQLDQAIILRVQMQMAYETKISNRAATAFRHFIRHDASYYCAHGLELTEGILDLPERYYFMEMSKIV